jgi:hypothetical protein
MCSDAYQCLEDSNSSRLHPSEHHGNTSNAHQSSTRNQISFTDIDMGRQLHPSGQQGNAVRTSGQRGPDAVLIMVITCSRSATVRMLGQHCPDVALI